jgi:putative membrane protein
MSLGYMVAMSRISGRLFFLAGTIVLVSCGVLSTHDFVRKAAMSDLYEIEAGKIAREKGQSDAVKEYAQHMIEAHSKTSKELRGIEEAEKLGVALPGHLGKRHHTMIEALKAAQPEEFDKAYAAQQVKAHQRAFDFYDEYAEDGDNAALKQFAANVLPTIKQHLEQAERIVP